MATVASTWLDSQNLNGLKLSDSRMNTQAQGEILSERNGCEDQLALGRVIDSCHGVIRVVQIGQEKCQALKKERLKMKEKMKELEEKIRPFDEILGNKHNQMMGQFGLQLESAVMARVLDGLVDPDTYVGTITAMEKAIRGKPDYVDIFKTTEGQKTAESRWKNLKTELRWTGRHLRYIQELKEYNLPVDGVIFERNLIQEAFVKCTLPEQDKELFEEVLGMYDHLNKN